MATDITVSTINVNAVYAKLADAVTAAGESLATQINAASLNPNDPVNMIKMQKELANYTLSLSVQSSVIKSLEETAKSITQKL